MKSEKSFEKQKFKVYKQKKWTIWIMKTGLKNWCLGILLFSTVWSEESFSPMKLDKEQLKIIMKGKM